jgi:hypothetical protein
MDLLQDLKEEVVDVVDVAVDEEQAPNTLLLL